MIDLFKQKWGSVPILARLDYGFDGSPLGVFSQELTPEQTRQFLRTADAFFQGDRLQTPSCISLSAGQHSEW